MKRNKYYQGKYTPKRPTKYNGDPTCIFYRSSWELKFFNWCDNNDAILRWSSEEIIIPYLCPTDNQWHRYFPDALITIKDVSGKIKTYLIEIKPFKQTIPPVAGKRKTRSYINEVMVWGKNSAKWKYAKNYCVQRGYEFKLLTEKELGI